MGHWLTIRFRFDWISSHRDGLGQSGEGSSRSPAEKQGTKLIVRGVGYLLQAGTGAIRSKSVDVLEVEYTPSNIRWFYNCGASSILAPWYAPRGGIIG